MRHTNLAIIREIRQRSEREVARKKESKEFSKKLLKIAQTYMAEVDKKNEAYYNRCR